jgi:hypothetical protein
MQCYELENAESNKLHLLYSVSCEFQRVRGGRIYVVRYYHLSNQGKSSFMSIPSIFADLLSISG